MDSGLFRSRTEVFPVFLLLPNLARALSISESSSLSEISDSSEDEDAAIRLLAPSNFAPVLSLSRAATAAAAASSFAVRKFLH